MAVQDELFRLFHQHSKLVRRKIANPLTHQNCGGFLVTSLGDKDELILVCYQCDTELTPGLNLINNVRAVVQEHFLGE